jgi:hypothetical protein
MVIAVDFDGTIVENRYPAIGKEIPFAIETLLLIQKELKHTLILWTVREGRELQDAIDFCKERGLAFYAANRNHPEPIPSSEARKLNADMFIDDRNFGGVPEWGFIYQSLKRYPDGCLSPEIFLKSLDSIEKKTQKSGFMAKLFNK